MIVKTPQGLEGTKGDTRMRLVCVFTPAPTGGEVHDADGSYLPAADPSRDTT